MKQLLSSPGQDRVQPSRQYWHRYHIFCLDSPSLPLSLSARVYSGVIVGRLGHLSTALHLHSPPPRYALCDLWHVMGGVWRVDFTFAEPENVNNTHVRRFSLLLSFDNGPTLTTVMISPSLCSCIPFKSNCQFRDYIMYWHGGALPPLAPAECYHYDVNHKTSSKQYFCLNQQLFSVGLLVRIYLLQ